MGLNFFSLALIAMSYLGSNIQTQQLERRVADSLGWYYRWIGDPSPSQQSIECRAALFGEKAFVYCEPGPLSMDIEIVDSGVLRVMNLIRSFVTYDDDLRDYRLHRSGASTLQGESRRLSFSAGSLQSCRVDNSKTARFAKDALPHDFVEKLRFEGLTLRYPKICFGDPFFLLYMLRGQEVETIWQFAEEKGQFALRWSYESSSAQRAISGRSRRAVHKHYLWWSAPRRSERRNP